MSNVFGVVPSQAQGVTLPFRVRSRNNTQFATLFREGMTLVEETADYLDGPGRREAKRLQPMASLAYATESMRLTTRLTQLATWLLARRAEMNGEPVLPGAGDGAGLFMPLTRSANTKAYAEMPERLKALIESCARLHERIHRLEAPQPPEEEPASRANPVATQVARIEAAFGNRA